MGCELLQGNSATHVTIQAHELGHNMGFQHAHGLDGGEYSDLSSTMASGSTQRCFNAPNIFQMK
jgi:Gametolysin peptidase M11